MNKLIIAVFLAVAAAPAGAQDALSGVIAATDPALAAAANAALGQLPTFTVPPPTAIQDERFSDTPAEEYLPIHRQAVLEYEYTSSEFTTPKVIRVEFMSYSAGDKTAAVNMIVFNKTRPKVSNFTVQNAADGIRSTDSPLAGPRIELPLPLAYNQVWHEGADRNRVAGLNTEISVPAGTYKGCLKIVTSLSGGDAGSAVRYYAPGVGLVYERINSEDRQETIKLTSYQLK